MILELAGYQVKDLIYEGTRTLVYRGIDRQNSRSVILKKLRKEYPTFNELLQFRHQYVITKNLDLPGIVKPLALEKEGNAYVLVMEEVGGISLSQCYQDRTPSLEEFFEIAIALTKILAGLYRNRIIHKDIKPPNILINPETKEIFLIDFSISSLLPRETQALQSLGQLEGTLAYTSPEQTGRMNRGIDYRSDFYSLGVTFYQLLAGQLPFNSDDGMELVHCHIAKVPPRLEGVAKDIPGVLSDLVLKLMAKTPEERYQSAAGIERDLNKCWQQWQTTGKIEYFELGQKDRSDRFLIPEKLYGREAEVKALLKAFDRIANPHPPHTPHTPQKGGRVEMMLVAGFSGIGKTVVVNEVHKPIVEKRGYFISGKFDQFNRNIPLSAFVIAFRDLIGQLLGESDSAIKKWKSQILSALGEQGKVIIDAIPELEKIISEQPEVSELSGSAAQNRFNLLFSKFLRVFATKEHPLVIFLDDLQWADSASLNLLKILTQKSESGYLLILGAYRDNEVYPAHPLMLTLEEIGKTSTTINTITLTPLPQSQINRLVADTLSCGLELAKPLTELVYQKTKGNPFFTNQFLKSLHEDGWIEFSVPRPGKFSDSVPRPGKFSDSDVAEAEGLEAVAEAEGLEAVAEAEGLEAVAEVEGLELEFGYWQCDITKVRELSLTEDVVEFMATRLYKLPETTREVLKLAACIGNQFDLGTLAIVSELSQTEAAASLWVALREGLVLPQDEIYKFYQGETTGGKVTDNLPHSPFPNYKFLHDRVQQAAYSLIPEEGKKSTHWKVGQLLLNNIPPEQREEKIFEIVNQLNYGTSLITEPQQRDELAGLDLIACRKARTATAYQAGREYASIGLSLLGERGWEYQYEMTLAFHDLAAELASLCGDFDAMEGFVETALARSRSLLERVNVYRIKIFAKVAQNQLTEALDIGVQLLQKLGVTFPDNPTPSDALEATREIKQLIGGGEIKDLIDLPWMSDAEKIAMVQIANSIIAPAYIIGSPLLPLVVALSVKLSIQYGNTHGCGFTYCAYAIIACNFVKDINTGVEFARLALQLATKLDAKDAKVVKAEAFPAAAFFGIHRRYHIKDTLKLAQEGYTASLEVGSLEFAGRSAYTFCYNGFWCGRSLADLSKETGTYCNGLVQLKQFTTANYCRIYWQSILNLLGDTEHPSILSGDAMQEAKLLPGLLSANDFFGLYCLYLYKLMLSYLFGEIEGARNHASEAKRYFMGGAGSVGEPVFYFYDSLSALASSSSPSQETLERVEQNQSQLQQYWANYAPMNHQHKVDLVAAEKSRVLGQKTEAIELYDKAIAGAKENEYIQEQALANELAAKFYLQWGKEKVAASYMQDAYYCYARWGAKAKVADLEKRYRQLLGPILEREKPSLPTNAVLKTTEATVTSTNTGTNVLLDFASAFQASLAIAGEIELEGLLSKLMEVVMKNAGATKGALLLPKDDALVIEAAAGYSEEGVLEMTSVGRSLSSESSKQLPQTILNVVKRTREALVINDLSKQARFASDSYLVRCQPKSILCLPLLGRGQLRGILYLENRLATGAFTSDRLELLKVLAAQAAISLENARLYQNLEQKVAARTQELNDKNQDLKAALVELKQTQAQLIQTEKMSSLGRMVAGIAHEINNPTAFIQGNISPAWHYFQDLLELIEIYREDFPNGSPRVTDKLQETELDYLKEDLGKLFASMNNGCDRITSIVRGLRTFSRLDEAQKKEIDIHVSIDSTIMLLQNRLRDADSIEVVKDYGKLPQITCYAAQLNQVFYHILSNAIDAFSSLKKSSAKPTITIRTEVVDKLNVKIVMSDNGNGMSRDTLAKIFDPFFTTKAVGKGTGLGMAIAYQIIVAEHGGNLTCSSELGKGTDTVITLPVTPLSIRN